MVTPFRQGRFADLPERPIRPHRFFDTEPREVTVDGGQGWPATRAHVRVYGAGPPLLLIHGLMTTSYSWRYVFEPLGRHYTCYAPDLPGAGRSEAALAADYRPHSLARWIGRLQAALSIPGCDVIGNSMGGYLAMVLALARPKAIGRLVNLHSPGVPELRLTALRAALRLPGSKRVLRGLIARDPLRWAHRNVHYYDESFKSLEEAHEYGDPLATHDGFEGFFKYLSETMLNGPMQAFQAELRERQRYRLGFPVPLMLAYAEQDPVVPPLIGTVLARRVPDAHFVWLREASHFAHVDATERFVDAVIAFLELPARAPRSQSAPASQAP